MACKVLKTFSRLIGNIEGRIIIVSINATLGKLKKSNKIKETSAKT